MPTVNSNNIISQYNLNMKKLILLFFALLVVSGVSAQEAYGTIKKETVTYKDNMVIDVFYDTAAKVEGRRPLFLHIHGGGWNATDRTLNISGSLAAPALMLRQGMVVATMQYRQGVMIERQKGKLKNVPIFGNTGDMAKIEGYMQVVHDALDMAVEDLYDATTYMVNHADRWNIDTSKVIIGGGSAGAINSLTAEYRLCNGDEVARKHLPAGFHYAGILALAGSIMMPANEYLSWKERPCPTLMTSGTADNQVPYNGIALGQDKWVGPRDIAGSLRHLHVPFCLYKGEGYDHLMAGLPFENYGYEIMAFIERCVIGQEHVAVETTETDYDGPRTIFSYFQAKLGISEQDLKAYIQSKNKEAAQ